MKVGLTYDLRSDYAAAGLGEEEVAEFDFAETIDAIEAGLRSLGHDVDRIGHLHDLVRRLARGERWDLVFNTAEGLCGFGREAEIPALLEGYGIPYTFSDPLVCALTLHKGMTKHLLRDLGIATPDFRVIAHAKEALQMDLAFPLFVKPVAEGTAKGIDGRSRVTNREALVAACSRVIEVYRQPALVESYLPGREFTVGVLGTGERAEAIGTLEIQLREAAEQNAYTYVNKERCEELCSYRRAEGEVAREVEALALRAWRGVGGRDAGRVDLRLDAAERPAVMELNVLPGLHPTHSDLPMICTGAGLRYEELIRRIVVSAEERIRVSRANRRATALRGDARSVLAAQP